MPTLRGRAPSLTTPSTAAVAGARPRPPLRCPPVPALAHPHHHHSVLPLLQPTSLKTPSHRAPWSAVKPTEGWRDGQYWTLLEIRPTDIDEFNVVSNTIYHQYLLWVHHKLFAAAAAPVPELVGAGYLPVTAETHVRFKRPLLPGDRVLATSGLARVTATRLFFADNILRLPAEGGQPQVAAEADVMVAFTGPDGRPRALRPDWRAGCEERAAQYAAAVAAAGGGRPILA